MKLEKRQKDKPEIVIHNEKSNKVEKHFKFLRRRIAKRFEVKENIPITTEDFSDLYIEIPLKIKNNDNTKDFILTVSRREMALLLECPGIHKSLNIKEILGYYCILFNEKTNCEFVAKLIYVSYNRDLKNILVDESIIKSEIAQPFVFVYNNWDNEFTFDKYMDTGENKPKTLRRRRIEEPIRNRFGFEDWARHKGWELNDDKAIDDKAINEGIPN